MTSLSDTNLFLSEHWALKFLVSSTKCGPLTSTAEQIIVPEKKENKTLPKVSVVYISAGDFPETQDTAVRRHIILLNTKQIESQSSLPLSKFQVKHSVGLKFRQHWVREAMQLSIFIKLYYTDVPSQPDIHDRRNLDERLLPRHSRRSHLPEITIASTGQPAA